MGCLPNSLQELEIFDCKAIRTLPKDGLPSSLRRLDVRRCGNEELKRHCRKLIGTIPIVEARSSRPASISPAPPASGPTASAGFGKSACVDHALDDVFLMPRPRRSRAGRDASRAGLLTASSS
ncbi:hypothetical protein EJB05_42517, partial [Eragrostis curvula]